MKIADGLEIRKADVRLLREQTVNARYMDHSTFNRMAVNIKRRGVLESMPYVSVSDAGKYEIISGHHRVQAAKEAGLREIHVLVDTSGLSRSEITAKQIAHNRLEGYDDEATLRRMLQSIESTERLLESGASDMLRLEAEAEEADSLPLPNLKIAFHEVALHFVSPQVQPPHERPSVHSIVVPMSLYPDFVKSLNDFMAAADIISVGVALSELLESCKS